MRSDIEQSTRLSVLDNGCTAVKHQFLCYLGPFSIGAMKAKATFRDLMVVERFDIKTFLLFGQERNFL
jgi:hypothetical protein